MTPTLHDDNKVSPPYPLGKFPANFISIVGKEIVYLLCTKATTSLEGSEWERIEGNLSQKRVRLISGRNSPSYSFNEGVINSKAAPDLIGNEVIAIWNSRVKDIFNRFPYMRTVVLIKSEDLLTLRVFEIETGFYDAALYSWSWNERGNLEGHRDNKHCFTWQPHGSQFTIIEDIPDNCIDFQIKPVPKLNEETVLKSIGFDSSWITLL